MGSALQNLPVCNHPDIIQAKFHLESAIHLAEKYGKTWNSIIWIRSKVSRKKSVKHELNAIAYDVHTELIMAAISINKYMVDCEIPGSVIDSLNEAYRSLYKEHEKEVDARQLSLVMQPIINLPLSIKSVEKVLVISHSEKSNKW
jgi:type III secretory pathway component EscV